MRLQFGRVGADVFILDVCHPLSVVQGFAAAVASMDRKLADRRAYELMRQVIRGGQAALRATRQKRKEHKSVS